MNAYRAPDTQPKQLWEHVVVRVSEDEMQEQLNFKSGKGWELVSVVRSFQIDSFFCLFFKRMWP